jgi:site-specific DNA-cytosine methylase
MSANADMWAMSPPCQPFTRNNTSNSRDNNDNRSRGFVHLISLLKQLKIPPQFIILEVSSYITVNSYNCLSLTNNNCNIIYT